MSEPYKRDWQKTRIHAFCGAVFGAGSAFASGGWVAILIGAIVAGLLAGIWLDQFWEKFIAWW